MTELQAYLLLALVGFVALMLIVMAFGQRRQNSPGFITAQILEATEAFGKAVQHHVQVNADLALMEQFRARPELVQNLAKYSQQVAAAALLSRVNALGGDIKVVERLLTRAREDAAHGFHGADGKVKRQEGALEKLYLELEATNEAAQQFGLLHSS